jgi:hypothetical protein
MASIPVSYPASGAASFTGDLPAYQGGDSADFLIIDTGEYLVTDTGERIALSDG